MIDRRSFIAVTATALTSTLFTLSGCSSSSKEPEASSSSASSHTSSDNTASSNDGSTGSNKFKKSTGPIIFDGSVEKGFTLYQIYSVGGGREQVFSFKNTSNSKYEASVKLNPDMMKSFVCKQIFSNDLSKFAVGWLDNSDGSRHVGWFDPEGNLTDVSNAIHSTASGFSSRTPQDYRALFTPDGYFFFADKNDDQYVYVDTDSLSIVKTKNFSDVHNPDNSTIYVLLGFDGEITIDYSVSPVGSGYSLGDGSETISVRKEISPLRADDRINELQLVGVGCESGSYYVAKYGKGFSSATDGHYYLDSNNITKLTPSTDYTISRCCYCDNWVAFSAYRGQSRKLFKVSSAGGEPEELCDLKSSEEVLFWI